MNIYKIIKLKFIPKNIKLKNKMKIKILMFNTNSNSNRKRLPQHWCQHYHCHRYKSLTNSVSDSGYC